jgi:hypothetical protein
MLRHDAGEDVAGEAAAAAHQGVSRAFLALTWLARGHHVRSNTLATGDSFVDRNSRL